MGLLLSILVFSVGVLEVIACVRHIQYGYLPEWAPRRHVLATGTSGLTILRDRWRRKPSKSADYDNKTKKSDYDVSRSCDVQYYRGECYDPILGSGLSEKCGSLPEHSEDLSASNFVSTDVGEFNLRYQEFEEILPREANIFNRCDDSEMCQYSEVSNRDGIDLSSQVGERDFTKSKPRPSFIDNLVSEENAIYYGQRSRSQSPSPRKSKADISWPLDVPRNPVSRRPSTPTTAEEDGGHSPYYGGEFLTEEHIRSTQRPLSVSTETYHADQDITPLLHKVDQESTRSLSRPLTVSLPDEHRKTNDVVPETTSTASADKSQQLVSSEFELTSLAPHSSDPVDNSVMLTSEEEAAKELCVKQKRRTSKTEYLPSHEEVAAIAHKELTPEPSFATRKEETRRLKPAKATSFEEARMETFDSGPLYADKSAVVNKEARRSSIVSSADGTDVILDLNVTERSGIDDSSALIGKLQVIAAKDQSQLEKNSTESTTGSWVTQVSAENKDSPHSEAGVKKNEGRKKQLQFDVGPDTSDIDISRSQFDKKDRSVNITPSPININEIYIRPMVEVTAIQTVDKIIDDAVARVAEIFSLMSSDDGYQQCDENADNETFLCDDEIDVSDGPGRKLVEHPNSTLQLAPTENISNPDGDFKTTHTGRSINNFGCDAEKVAPKKKEEDKETSLLHTERDIVADTKEIYQYSKIDSTNTNTLNEGTCETSETSGNRTESVPQTEEISSSKILEDLVSNNSTVSITQSKNKDDVGESPSKKDVLSTVGPKKEKCQITKQDNGQSNDPVLHHTKPSEENPGLCSSVKTDYSETDKDTDVSKKNLENINRSGDTSEGESSRVQISKEQQQSQQQQQQSQQQQKQQESSKTAPEAFWLIFSGEYTKAMSKDWHSGHFCCWQCDESLTGQRYVLRDDHPYCIKCYESVFANTCEECNRTIGIDSKDLSYKDKHWHEACFLCTKCRVSLVDKQFGSKADKIYCGNCYDAQFASRCDGCGEIFRAGTKKMEYKTRQWHEKCFCCCVCKSAIGTKSFIPREQEIYCATCYEEKFATRCVKCNKIITSGGVTYKNEPWHRECFTCTNCNTSLAGQRFTSRDEKPYCAECFGELFAKRCTSCSKPITGIGGTRFISFEDRHWHNDCFICASCKTSLVGRGFITDGDDIICPECAKQKLM